MLVMAQRMSFNFIKGPRFGLILLFERLKGLFYDCFTAFSLRVNKKNIGLVAIVTFQATSMIVKDKVVEISLIKKSAVVIDVYSWQVEVEAVEVLPLGAGEDLGVRLLPPERVL